MIDWGEKLNAFLEFHDRDILMNAGSASHEMAKGFAEKAYEKFSQKRLEMPDKDDFDTYLDEHEWTQSK